ncbi:MAG: hypothetical protein SGI86_07370, partial [Deltaproteobacteria bacterium]|nr:hypothetical protein [Deltaproteobacteria bacterium]
IAVRVQRLARWEWRRDSTNVRRKHAFNLTAVAEDLAIRRRHDCLCDCSANQRCSGDQGISYYWIIINYLNCRA